MNDKIPMTKEATMTKRKESFVIGMGERVSWWINE